MSTTLSFKNKLQNLIDLKGQDIELVGPDMMDEFQNIIDEFNQITSDLDDQLVAKETRINELETIIQNMEDEEDDFSHSIDTGLDTIRISLEKGNLQDTQAVEAFVGAYEKGIKPLTIASTLESLN